MPGEARKKMKSWIEVEDYEEAQLIREGLRDGQVRALVKVMGTLRPLPSDRRRRVLQYVVDKLQIPL
jgi:hypothetical protein